MLIETGMLLAMLAGPPISIDQPRQGTTPIIMVKQQRGVKPKPKPGLPPWCKPKGHMDCDKGKSSKT